MNTHCLRTATFLAFAALGLGAAAAQQITVTHAQGETTLDGVPTRVITFDLASLDTLEALGVDILGLPGSNLPGYLQKYAGDEYLKVGTLFEPDYEAVNAAEPDLIIVAGRSSAALPELSRIAPTIDLSNGWEDFEGAVRANSVTLGEIFDKTGEVEALLAELDAAKADAQAAAATAGTGLIVLTSGGSVTAYGPGSRFGWIHETAGVVPAVEDVEAATHGDAISFEFILETNPDWLFVVDRDAGTGTSVEGAAAHQVLDNELVAQTTAWSQGQVVYIDPARSYIINGGLPALTYLVRQVGDALAAAR